MNAKWFGCWLVASLLLVAGGAVDARAEADLVLTKVGPLLPLTPGAPSPDDEVVYTITITNNGPDAATNVDVTDYSPAGLTFDSNTGDCTAAYPCLFASVGIGESRTITSTYILSPSYSPPNALQNYAEVVSDDDPNPDNDYATVDTPVTGRNCGNYSVSGGEYFTCAIVAGNDRDPPNTVEHDLVECWGDNSGAQSSPLPSDTFNAVSAGGFHACGLKKTGGIECWGDDYWGNVTDAPAGTDFIQVDAGFDHTCALHANVVIHAVGALCRASLARPTFSMIS